MFHPAVQTWFERSFQAATAVQLAAWAEIEQGRDVLIAAPTGSGKTFAAFLCAINRLLVESRQCALPESVQVLYVSPLKALSNDIEKNLQLPLQGIESWLAEQGMGQAGIRAMVRTGDTTPGEREQMRRHPPQILVTTPESLYLLLTSQSGRGMLSTVREVIVDEIHAVAGSKRGSHLALSLARLDAILPQVARRIGLSATQKPISEIAHFLTGGRTCSIVDIGHQRQRDLALEIPQSPLAAVMANEVWEEIYNRLQQLVEGHRTTLIFVNTRRMAERVARHLAERLTETLGESSVTAHHGSLSREHRLEAEQALKSGRLRALVATASLELGIDIGHVDLVCQLGSPGSISAFIQRVGRSGHGVGETPKGRLFPLSRDDLLECIALLRSVEQGVLDRIQVPAAPLDVLAQQLVAELSARDWDSAALFAMVKTAWPYRALKQAAFDQLLDMLANGYATRRGRRGAYIHHDVINGRLRARPLARLTALQNGGAIPDQFDYEVIMQPQGFRVGTLIEDFAFESLPGDIFQLGNNSYKILKVEQSRVLVEDAHGQPPTIPFWVGYAPGRSDELSLAVSELREQLQVRLRTQSSPEVIDWLNSTLSLPAAAGQAVEYMAAVLGALGCIPTQKQMVLERFFDDTGDMHLIIHAPLGSRIMRAWGLALRKRFCRHFNFELQAAALEDCLILSLGETHSFDRDSVAAFLNSASVREVLVQALLDAPMFGVRWRWNATIALAIQRMRNGKKLPPQWQRNQAEDLVAVVFPDQLACLENIRGEREIPDHPLVQQTISDCLHENMDVVGLEHVLASRERGEVAISCVDLVAPSPLAAEIINARPYAFLDDGDAENRRTRAISQRGNDLVDAAMLSIISRTAIEQVQAECWIAPRNPDELHDGLMQLGFLSAEEFSAGTVGGAGSAAPSNTLGADTRLWGRWFQALAEEGRACCVSAVPEPQNELATDPATNPAAKRQWWLATERLAEFLALDPSRRANPDPGPEWTEKNRPEFEQALAELLRSRLSGLGPVTVTSLAHDFGLPVNRIEPALLGLQTEGYVMSMDSAALDSAAEPSLSDAGLRPGQPRLWCERRLLARIHRYSREKRRQSRRTVTPASFMRFLIAWHGLESLGQRHETKKGEAKTALNIHEAGHLATAMSALEGWTAPLSAWEPELLQSRCRNYSAQALDQVFLSGQWAWFRPGVGASDRQQLISATPIAMVPRQALSVWQVHADDPKENLPDAAAAILDLLQQKGAMFTADLMPATGVLQPQLEQALGLLVARGLITADAFSPLRWLARPEQEKRRKLRVAQRAPGRGSAGQVMLGRWSRFNPSGNTSAGPDQHGIALICLALLKRYGVVFRALLERETLLPPWRDLLRYFRRMEDRGEVLGGRFVDGFSGEQFALAEAVGLLRNLDHQAASGTSVVIAACDPLNLGGIITSGVKTPAINGYRILLQDGLPVARMQGDKIEVLDSKLESRAAQLRLQLSPLRHLHRHEA